MLRLSVRDVGEIGVQLFGNVSVSFGNVSVNFFGDI